MRVKTWLMALALPVALSGCYTGRARVAYATYDPPPPQVAYVDQRPGHVWVDGYWYWNRYDYAWRPGYYVVDRPGYAYVQGRYHNRIYRPGHWNARRSVVVDHRPGRLYVKHPYRGAPRGRTIIRSHRR